VLVFLLLLLLPSQILIIFDLELLIVKFVLRKFFSVFGFNNVFVRVDLVQFFEAFAGGSLLGLYFLAKPGKHLLCDFLFWAMFGRSLFFLHLGANL